MEGPEGEHIPAVRAAGVLLLREGIAGPEAFVVQEGGLYADPGGKLSWEGEEPAAAAAREFREEAGGEPPGLGGLERVHVRSAKYLLFLGAPPEGWVAPPGAGAWLPLGKVLTRLHPRLMPAMNLILARAYAEEPEGAEVPWEQ